MLRANKAIWAAFLVAPRIPQEDIKYYKITYWGVKLGQWCETRKARLIKYIKKHNAPANKNIKNRRRGCRPREKREEKATFAV
jgi:hypothetical protein